MDPDPPHNPRGNKPPFIVLPTSTLFIDPSLPSPATTSLSSLWSTTTFSSSKSTTTTTVISTTEPDPTSTCTLAENCPAPTCPQPCKSGYVCRLSVINANCQCPTATCVRPGFDTGGNLTDGGTRWPKNPMAIQPSILGPLLGGIAALLIIVVGIITLLRIRMKTRQEQQQRALLDADTFHSSNPDHHFHSQDWHGSSCVETTGVRTVDDKDNIIRIGYAPSVVIRTTSINNDREDYQDQPVHLPDLTAQSLDRQRPHAPFMYEDEPNKHFSLASDSSTSTGVLNEAVVMAITRSPAIPQVLRLDTIRNVDQEMIQRSNSLHSSNSIKRTLSQLSGYGIGRHMSKKNEAGAAVITTSPSMPGISSGSMVDPEGGRLELTIDHDDFEYNSSLGSFMDGQYHGMNSHSMSPTSSAPNSGEITYMYTPAVIVTGPSTRSSAQSTASSSPTTSQRPSGPSMPSMVLESRPFQTISTSSSTGYSGYYSKSVPSSSFHDKFNSVSKPACLPHVPYPITATNKSPSLPTSLEMFPSSGGEETVASPPPVTVVTGSNSAPTTALVSLLASTVSSPSSDNTPPKISTSTPPTMFTFSSSTVHPLSSSSSTSFYSFKSLPGTSPISAPGSASPMTPQGYSAFPSPGLGLYNTSGVNGSPPTTVGATSGCSSNGGSSSAGVATTTRDSALSTLSSIDAPSTSATTRGDGEEIMIFWDGHRGSRSSANL